MQKSLLCAIVLIMLASSALGGVESLLRYQGKLMDTNGLPVNKTVWVTVNLYTNETGGPSNFYEKVGNVPVQQGLYEFSFGLRGETYQIDGATSVLQSTEIIGTGNGSKKYFTNTVQHVPIIVGSADITDGTYSWNDVGGSSESRFECFLNRTNGKVSVEYRTDLPAPPIGTNITIAYNYSNAYIIVTTNYAPISPANLQTQPVWMEISLDGAPLAPRQRLMATPYALASAKADNSDALGGLAASRYATGTPVYVERDPRWTSQSGSVWTAINGKQPVGNYATGTPVYAETDPRWTGQSGTVWSAINGKQPVGNYATGTPVYVEGDPRWTGQSGTVWSAINGKQSMGNYATGMPLYGFTEHDPDFAASVAADISQSDTGNWSQAYAWGNHRTVGYLSTTTSFGGDVMGMYSNLMVSSFQTADTPSNLLSMLLLNKAEIIELQGKCGVSPSPIIDIFSEATTDANGYRDSINLAQTTALYLNNEYKATHITDLNNVYAQVVRSEGWKLMRTIYPLATQSVFKVANSLKSEHLGESNNLYCFIKYYYTDGTSANSITQCYPFSEWSPYEYANPVQVKAVSRVEEWAMFDPGMGSYDRIGRTTNCYLYVKAPHNVVFIFTAQNPVLSVWLESKMQRVSGDSVSYTISDGINTYSNLNMGERHFLPEPLQPGINIKLYMNCSTQQTTTFTSMSAIAMRYWRQNP